MSYQNTKLVQQKGFYNCKSIFGLSRYMKMRSFILVMVGISLGYASNLDPSIEGSMESGAMNSMRRNPKLFWGVSKHHPYSKQGYIFNAKHF